MLFDFFSIQMEGIRFGSYEIFISRVREIELIDNQLKKIKSLKI